MSKEKYTIIIEYPKGKDKGPDQFRPDTKPILKAVQNMPIVMVKLFFIRIKGVKNSSSIF